MTEKQLSDVIKKFGMEKYDPIDEPFDLNRHNAVFQVPDASKPEGAVAHVLNVNCYLLVSLIVPYFIVLTPISNDGVDMYSLDTRCLIEL